MYLCSFIKKITWGGTLASSNTLSYNEVASGIWFKVHPDVVALQVNDIKQVHETVFLASFSSFLGVSEQKQRNYVIPSG